MLDLVPLGAIAVNDIPITILAFVVGCSIGSFLNVLVYRLPIMYLRALENAAAEVRNEPLPHTGTYNLALPRSQCDHCGRRLSAFDMVPVFSFLFLAGKCRTCREPIGIRVFLVELVLGLLSALIVWKTGVSIMALAVLVFLYGGAALALVDSAIRELPDPINYVMIAAGLVFNLLGLFVPYDNALLALLTLYLTGWGLCNLLRVIWSDAKGVERMGYGDFKLMAMLGAWFGFYAFHVLAASCIAAIIYCLLNASYIGKKMLTRSVSFGPFLILSGYGYLFLRLSGFVH